MNLDSVAVVSGGMDSITLLHYMVKEQLLSPAVIAFNYGQKHFRELQCVDYHVKALGLPTPEILDLTNLMTLFHRSSLINPEQPVPDATAVVQNDQPPSSYVPNRNMLFLAIAVAFAENSGMEKVFYGAQRHDIYGYWDTTKTFLSKLNELYALNPETVQIEAPFVDFSKANILQVGLRLDVDYAHTWSCYRGEEKACGTCPTCVERLAAFEQLDMTDPIEYK